MPPLSHRLAQPTARVAVRDAVYPEYPSTPVSPMDMRAMFPLISNTPPSATSVSSSHSFEGVSWFPCVSQSPEQFQPMNMEHSLQPVSPTHTPGIMSERNNSPFSAQRLEQVSNNLLPAWNGDLEFGTTNSISYIQIPGTTMSPLAPHIEKQNVIITPWTCPAFPSRQSASFSSLPGTPNQPRKSQRFTSLPSLPQHRELFPVLSAYPTLKSRETIPLPLNTPFKKQGDLQFQSV